MILTTPPTYCDGWFYDPTRKLWISTRPTGSRDIPVLLWHFSVNPESMIDEVLITLNGSGGGLEHTAMPFNRPRMTVGKLHSGTATDLSSATDNPGTLAGFNASHEFAAQLLPGQQDPDYVDHYWLELQGASGLGAQPGSLALEKITIVPL